MDPAALLSAQTAAFRPPALRQVTLDVAKVNGINLGQGVCNLPPPPFILERAHEAMKSGLNRYTNPRGLISLREAIADKLLRHNGFRADPERDVHATCGVTGAFEGICGITLNPGDHAIVFEPYYPYHLQALQRYGADVSYVPFEPDASVDFDRLRDALRPGTKLVLLNTPGNPTGKVWNRAELEELGRILEPTNALVATDEIYEYMAFDGRRHVSPASVPALAGRTATMGGYSKTFSITGWRIGYVCTPPALSEPMSAFLDAVYVCPPAPLQQAVAEGIREFGDAFYGELRAKYEAKRDRFASGLRPLGLSPWLPEGAYYMLCSFEDRFPDLDSAGFAAKLIQETGVGAVPSSDFVRRPQEARWVRFCLANEDDVLDEALRRMATLV